MRHEKRTRWYLIQCDLAGCDRYTVVHPVLGEDDHPLDWFFIKPPTYWRGPELSFCSAEHRDLFVGNVIRPQLGAGDGG